MQNQDQKSIKSLFVECLRRDDPQERRDFLDEACGDDQGMKDEVLALLSAHGSQDSFLERSFDAVSATAAMPAVAERPGTMIGPYKLLQRIGEGGFGVVYMAQQTEPVRRKVALKLIKPGMDSKEILARFEAERQALAMMDHPNIARVLDGGTTEQGRPYFVMELVHGVPITEFCNAGRLTTRERLELFANVCRAVQHAHQKGIIHRDLKPSNVLITMNDDRPMPRVIDFGVSKAVSEQLTERTLFTAYGQMVGTPMYMSPEQAQFSARDVDTRSDVYSLGVMLYEMLTGTTPFDRETLKKSGFDELRRLIREVDPPRPSARVSTLENKALSTVSERRRIDANKLSHSLRGELDWIVMQALEKDRTRRYESASAFAADIERYLSDEPVQACPPSLRYRLGKYARRHKGLLTTATLVMLTMLAGTALASWQAVVAQREAIRANQAEDGAQEARSAAEEQALLARRAADEARASEESESRQRQRAERALYVSDTRLAASRAKDDRASEAVELLLRQYPVGSRDDYRSWDWYYLLAEANQSLLSWQAHYTNISSVDWSPDGTRIATASHDGSARIWDAATGKELHRFQDGRSLKNAVNWHPQGSLLAWGSASNDSLVRIWNESTRAVTQLDPETHDYSVWAVSWSRDGSRLAVGTIGRPEIQNLSIWEFVDDNWCVRARASTGTNITSVDWDAADDRIAVCSASDIKVFDAATLESVHQIPRSGARRSAWHPLQSQLAYCTSSGECVILDGDSFAETRRFKAHVESVEHVAWSPDGQWLASCGHDESVRIWNTSDWSLHATYSGHEGIVNRVSWHPASDRLASVGFDGVINIWPLTSQRPQFQLDIGRQKFAWTADNLIRTLSDRLSILDRDPRTWNTLRTIELPEPGSWVINGPGLCTRRYQDESRVTADVVAIDGEHRLSGRCLNVRPEMPEDANYPLFCAMPDRNAFAVFWSSINFSRPSLIGFADGVERKLGVAKVSYIRQIACSPDGRILALIGMGQETDEGYLAHYAHLYLIDAISGADLGHLLVGPNRVGGAALAWSPNSQRIAAATDDGVCEIFNAVRHNQLLSRQIHRGRVNSLNWHPNGLRIASGGVDGTVNVWDSVTGEVLLAFELGDPVTQVEWSPDGTMLAAQLGTNVIHVWDSMRGHTFADSDQFQGRITWRAWRDFVTAMGAEDFRGARDSAQRLIDDERSSAFLSYPSFYRLALLCAMEGQPDACRDVCRRMLISFAEVEDPDAVGFTVWTCVLIPGAVEDYTRPVQLARDALVDDAENRQRLVELGAILMRAGEHDEAQETLQAALRVDDNEATSEGYIRYFLAMTEHHLGNAEAALEQLQAANEVAAAELANSAAWNRRLTLELLRKEAEQLLGIAKPADAPLERN